MTAFAFTPMLAQASRTIHPDVEQAVTMLTNQGGWSFEIKWDGIRCLAFCQGSTITLINRVRRDITHRYPDVVAQLAALNLNSAVLDGELACFTPAGLSFPDVHRRDAQSKADSIARLAASLPATLLPFDLLQHNGTDLRALDLTQRRQRLTDAVGGTLVVPEAYTDGAAVWSVVKDRKMEGLIAKRSASPYTNGRSPAWVKLKAVRRLTAIITGSEAGNGSRSATFGSATLALLDHDQPTHLRPIGSVGSGFTEHDLADLAPRIAAGELLLAEIEYLEVGSGGQLRFPVFKGIRTDVTIDGAGVDQLA